MAAYHVSTGSDDKLRMAVAQRLRMNASDFTNHLAEFAVT